MKCYIPFLIRMERGLEVLREYGGSFFTKRQLAMGDQLSISDHYGRLKERLVEYDHHLRELYMAAQKESLHSVQSAKVSFLF